MPSEHSYSADPRSEPCQKVPAGSSSPGSHTLIAAMLTAPLYAATRPKRGRGRPRRKDAAFFADVLQGHEGVVAWHMESHGGSAKSEAALYQAFRRHVAATVDADGIVAQAARDAVIGPRLKTVLNTLAEARAFFKKHPEKHPFTGTDTAPANESNCNLKESDA